jgi:hypothetical protein
MKRIVSKYSRRAPYEQIDEHEILCSASEMRHLFDVDDDQDMIFVYQIKSDDQVSFFKNLGVPIEPKEGFWYVECYEE